MAALGLAPALGSATSPLPAVDIARELGALQAQDYRSGAWSLGVRSGLTLAQIEQAVLDRTIVRTWPMRGTIHWVAAQDARWMCELLAGRALRSAGARHRQLGITQAQLARAGELFEAHLTEPMSRPDVMALLAAAGIDPSGQRGIHVLGHHCMTGLLCQGPILGKQASFVLIDAWVAGSLQPLREEAMSIVIERYVRSHGPVTEKDVAGWIGGTLGFVREALALISDRITSEGVDGRTWLTHVAARQSPSGPLGVHLLPQWDEFLLGYGSRDVTLPDEHLSAVVPGRNMVFQPTLVIDGEVAGVWKRAQSGGRTRIDVRAFSALNASQRRGIDRAAAAYGTFIGADVDLRLEVG